MSFLQPITIDLHMTGNPWSNYNIYLSSIMVPGIFGIFIFLITVYSIGTELKFGRGRDWMRLSGYNIVVALAGKFLPQFLSLHHGLPRLYDLYLRPSRLPRPRRPVLHPAAHAPDGVGERRLRHLHLRTDALPAHVDEYQFALGRARGERLWRHLPRRRHGPHHTGSLLPLPASPLLDRSTSSTSSRASRSPTATST